MTSAVEPPGIGPAAVTLPARPEPIRVDPASSAVIVIDMQNAYASAGGYVDLAGFDVTGVASVIGRIAQVLDTARGGWDYELVDALAP